MLDTPTLLAIVTFISIFVSLLVLVVWRRDRRYAGMQAVKVGLGFLALGLIAQSGRVLAGSSVNQTVMIVLVNVLIVSGSILTVNGSVLLAGGRAGWRRDAIAAGVTAVPFSYFLLVQPSTQYRILALGLFTAFLCLGAVISLLRARDATSRITRLVLVGILTMHAVSETVRAAGAGYLYPIADYVTRNPVVTIFLLEYILAVLALTVIALQLVSERLQRDLQQSEARIASAFEVASDAFAVFDGRGRLVVANPRFGEMFPDAAPAARRGAPLDAALAGGTAHFGLSADWITRGDDGFVPAETRDRVVQLPGGAWVHVSASTTTGGGLVLCWSDITDFKQAETVLANELAREREMAAMQRSFVSMASHQFRTPLSVIDINAQLIGRQPADAAERTGRIRRTVRRMINLIEVMLGAASAEAGKIEPQRAPNDLAALIRDACERQQEVAPNRVIEQDLDRLPPSVSCDGNLIDQVIGNLLSNAVKYSSRTQKVEISGTTEGNTAVIRVTDHGVGIAPEDQPLIFERFFRARNAGGVAGTGIGLTLARYVVDLHGGDISVRSALGAGSTFTVRLPIA